jgi:hypothetical protein
MRSREADLLALLFCGSTAVECIVFLFRFALQATSDSLPNANRGQISTYVLVTVRVKIKLFQLVLLRLVV